MEAPTEGVELAYVPPSLAEDDEEKVIDESTSQSSSSCRSKFRETPQDDARKPTSFFGADHVRGNFRSWEQLVLTLCGTVITAFGLVGGLQDVVTSPIWQTDFRSTVQFLLYVFVCAPLAVVYQAVNAGNQPGSPWHWSFISAAICATAGFAQLRESYLALVRDDGGALGKASHQAVGFFGCACWFVSAANQVLYGVGSLTGATLPKKLRHAEQLTEAREGRVRELLLRRKGGENDEPRPTRRRQPEGGVVSGPQPPTKAKTRTTRTSTAKKKSPEKSPPPDGRPVGALSRRQRPDEGTVVLVANPGCEVTMVGEGRFEVRPLIGDAVDLDAVFFVVEDDDPPTPAVQEPKQEPKTFSLSNWFESYFQSAADEKKDLDVATEEEEDGGDVERAEDLSDDDDDDARVASAPKLTRTVSKMGSSVSDAVGDAVFKSFLGGTFGLGRADPNAESWNAWFLRSSRPPLIFSSVLGSFVIVGAIGVWFLQLRLTRFGKVAANLRDIGDSFADLATDDGTRTATQLYNYADVFEQVEEDVNASWQAGGWIALVATLALVTTYVPSFDRSVARAARGGYRRGPGVPPRPEERVAYGANLFGAFVSIALLSFIFLSIVVALGTMCLVNQGIRDFLWDHRALAISYGISYVLKTFVLQPAVFHYYATDGFLVKRDVPFYVCNVAWIAYGVIVGATVAVARVGLYFAFSLVASADLGDCFLPEPVANVDYAHMAYTAEVHLHNNHHNTVAHVFADNLRDEVRGNDDDDDDESSRRQTRSRVRNKWQLAYTLIHNPKLRIERRRRWL